MGLCYNAVSICVLSALDFAILMTAKMHAKWLCIQRPNIITYHDVVICPWNLLSRIQPRTFHKSLIQPIKNMGEVADSVMH